MNRREALEMARSLAPEASASEHVVYAAYLEGSDAVEASEALPVVWEDWTETAAKGSIALVGDGFSYVREAEGWILFSQYDGHQYWNSPVGNLKNMGAYFVGYVRNVNPFVGQYVLESNDGLYSVGTVALDNDMDVWYYLGEGEWSVYTRANQGRLIDTYVSTSQAPEWGAVVVA